MPRALNLLRASLHYRREAFDAGLRTAGFDVVPVLENPGPGDLLLIWNRYGGYHDEACRFEACGGRVLVTENGYLGKTWRDGEWFALAEGHHSGAGTWRDHGPDRWDGWNVDLAPFRRSGHETVILGQRGIGEPGVRSPSNWAEAVLSLCDRSRYRIRQHPGTGAAKPIAEDLADARAVCTWSSGAALQALLLGIPVWYSFPNWIGARAGARWPQTGNTEANRDDESRLHMFRRLAWSMWTLDEIRTGEPIRCALEG